MSQADDWFHNLIVEGLQALHTLALPNTPAADTIQLPALVWIETLWSGRAWNEEQDTPRLRAAFVSLAGSVDRWPAPRALLAHLPAPAWQPLLPAPRPTEAERELAKRELKAMRQRFTEAVLSKGRRA